CGRMGCSARSRSSGYERGSGVRRLVTSDCGNFKTRYAEETALFPNDVGRLALGAFLIVWFLVVPAAAGPYLLGVANLTGIAVIVHWDWLTGGTSGLPVPQARLGGWALSGERRYFWVIGAAVVLVTWLHLNLIRTRVGRAFVAIRDNDRAAAAIGIHLFSYKLLAFFLSAFMAGVAGALYAYYLGVVVPGKFTLDLSIDYLAMGIV